MAEEAFRPSHQHVFAFFFESWLLKLEGLLHELEQVLTVINVFSNSGGNHHIQAEYNKTLISRVVSHYREFYKEQAKAAKEEDGFLILSPPWLSSFEHSMLWASGFKPSLLFPLLERSVPAQEFSAEQKHAIEALKAQTRLLERGVSQAMARVQQIVAEPPVYGAAKKFGSLKGGGDSTEMDEAMVELKKAMVAVVGNADDLRGWTASELLGILQPLQGVKLLAAAARFQLQARKWGMEKDSQRDQSAAADVAFYP